MNGVYRDGVTTTAEFDALVTSIHTTTAATGSPWTSIANAF